MSEHSNKAAERGSMRYQGREYVNMTAFADRFHVTKMAISKAVKSGLLTAITIDHYKGKWLDWEMQRAIYLKNGQTPTSRQPKSNEAFFTVRKIHNKDVGVPSDRISDIAVSDVPNGELLAKFDAESPENADCWEYNEVGEEMLVPSTQKHFIDWKKAIDKCMAQIRHQQYLEKEGQLISKDEVTKALSEIFPPVTSSIMQLPDRYATRINGRLEDMIGRAMTNEEKTTLKSVLQDEAERICHNLQDAIRKTLDEQL